MASYCNSKVVVGMSGGVDSSVAALLLKEMGCDVSAIFMQNWEDDDEHCTARQDYRDARGVCERLGIPLQTVNFAEEYWQRVFQNFLQEYSAGRTPNPDILCNREIKFKAFLDHAQAQGNEFIATGHYARVEHDSAQARMLRGLDENKDQTYFLYTLGQQQLRHTLFPIGSMQKSEVRSMAKAARIHVHTKKDSTGICFIGERKFRQFLAEYLPAKPGNIIDQEGTVLGKHQGLMYYTLGQRQGLGIGGLENAEESPWYVLDKRVTTGDLVVGQGHNHPQLLRRTLHAHDLYWCADSAPQLQFRCSAKIRYRQQDQQATVQLEQDKRSLSIEFDEPVRAATPGQSLVLYDGEYCLGGGIISDFVSADTIAT